MNFPLFIAFVLFAFRRALTYLHIFQQEEYDGARFSRWIFEQRSFDTRASLALLALWILQLIHVTPAAVASLIGAVALLALMLIEKDPRKGSKKTLVMTARAKRIYFTGLAMLIVLALLCTLLRLPLVFWMVLVQLIPFALIAGTAATAPYEHKVQQRFWNEAHAKLGSLKPTVIGITGSFGKTSTKHLLGHILEVQAPTLITPGSVNTPMGIARIVRERLGSHHRFFVCEMGAYGPGSIARLCRLAPPDVGLITAIGMAHYERFKTLDAVAETKFELAEAVAKRGGPVIIAEQVLEFAAARAFRDKYRQQTIVVGPGPECSLRVISSAQTNAGIQAEVTWDGRTYLLKAPLYGEHHIMNMALSFAAACSLGVPPEDAILALASVPQISHRLEVKQGPAGARLIDDAYNSNPVGFASGLRLLSELHANGGRRILVTPGMVELGAAHDEEHRKIGELAGRYVDVLLPVLPERISTLTQAYTAVNPQGTVIPCANFAAARAWLDSNVRASDVILMENDLPDLYETKLRL